MAKVRVLFVCMGNICRSPTAHGLFRALVEAEGMGEEIEIDSAGTHAYHVGEPPDNRAQSTAARRGIRLGDLRARQVTEQDFESYDYLLAMDQDNYLSLSSLCPDGLQDKLCLLMDFAPEMRIREVPDPYYGGPKGFERVFDLLNAAARGLLEDLRHRHF